MRREMLKLDGSFESVWIDDETGEEFDGPERPKPRDLSGCRSPIMGPVQSTLINDFKAWVPPTVVQLPALEQIAAEITSEPLPPAYRAQAQLYLRSSTPPAPVKPHAGYYLGGAIFLLVTLFAVLMALNAFLEAVL